MEAFNLLKFWRNSGRDTPSCRYIVSEIDDLDYVRNPVIETDEESDDDADSYFDLVFTGPNERPKLDDNNNSKSSLPVNSSRDPESPRDVFFKPKPFPIDSNTKTQSPTSILKSAPKFRVFFLGLKKTRPEKVGIDDSSPASPKIQTAKTMLKAESKRFAVSPVFTRDNSLRSKLQNEKDEEEKEVSVDESLKKFVRADVPKYLKLMKPLYARASKRYTDKVSISPLSSPSTQSMCSPRKEDKRATAFGGVRKHLGKSRSAASTFAGASSPPLYRRDDSLLQEQKDGIQGAILHCKRSYSSVAKGTCCEDLPRASSEELIRWSI